MEAQLEQFLSLQSSSRFSDDQVTKRFIRGENTAITYFDGHYIYHPAWATRIIKNIQPAKHIDISSTLHFCTMLSTHMPVEFYDYRPAQLNLSNLKCGSADLSSLHFLSGSIHSLSCMHTVEHIGLSRYGDPLDPDGDIKAMQELQRVLAPGGHLLFVVPVGKPSVVFNAHRIYSYEMIMEYFEGLTVKDFSLVDDRNQFHSPSAPEDVALQQYGCGYFWFQKPLS
jgi:SAM-dependent methyltransferase